MKENILDVLMYLFENYMDDDTQLEQDPETLKVELSAAGFPHAEINKAFAWLEDLAEQQELLTDRPIYENTAIRVFTQIEEDKMDIQCRGFLLFLEQVGILDIASRELVIDRSMALDTEEISLDQLKWVILMVLFNQPGQEANFAWMEDLVYDERPRVMH